MHDILKAVNLLKSNNVESAIEALNSVVKDLNKRNKVVRIADKYGWDVVQEYQDDPITDDADDATKLRQAIFRAKKRNNNRKPYERTNRSYSGQDSQGLQGQFFSSAWAGYWIKFHQSRVWKISLLSTVHIISAMVQKGGIIFKWK